MTNQEFTDIAISMIEGCKNTLIAKAKIYASTDDRLHNFKVAARLQNCTPHQALGGMLSKHLVALFDYIRDDATFEEWQEKITDSINYLLLLWALVNERESTEPSFSSREPSTDLYEKVNITQVARDEIEELRRRIG